MSGVSIRNQSRLPLAAVTLSAILAAGPVTAYADALGVQLGVRSSAV